MAEQILNRARGLMLSLQEMIPLLGVLNSFLKWLQHTRPGPGYDDILLNYPRYN